MTKDDIIYKFINEQVFPDVNWSRYNLSNSKGTYISCNHWCKISNMFTLTKDETSRHLNCYVRRKVNVPLDFNVILESLFDEEEMYTTTMTTAAVAV